MKKFNLNAIVSFKICKFCGELVDDTEEALLDHIKTDHPDVISNTNDILETQEAINHIIDSCYAE